MIEVRNLDKTFDGQPVLTGIDAAFEAGKTNLIIGRSGSGKTVLLRCLTGLLTPDSGQVLYDGRNLVDMTVNEVKKLHQEVGMLFQGSALFDSQTVLENVMFPLEMFSNKTRKEIEERAKFCLSRVNIDPVAFKLAPSEISGGMQKRVAIARAIALNPKYLFCDEPNSGLDPVTSIVIDKLIAEITQEYDITTIVNTHDMNSIMETGDNIVLIKKGVKAWQGSRNDIFQSDNEALNDFVFASQLFKEVRQAQNR